MSSNISFLELKYGNIYGGPPNFYVISEASLLVFEPSTNRIFLESMENRVDANIVNVFSRIDTLGNTTERVREVVNLKTKRTLPYDPDFQIDEQALDKTFFNLRPTKRFVNNFFFKNFRKYRVQNIVTFDGRRDIFLCQKAKVDFGRMKVFDLQKAINKETDYLFSLNKLAVVIDFRCEDSNLKSHNEKYWLHPIAAKQVVPKTAAFDAARQLMVYQEYRKHHDDFLMKAALLLNKIESAKTT